MVKCWEKEPKERPTFSDLVRDFEQLLVKEMDYIDLNLFPENDYYNEAIHKSTKTTKNKTRISYQDSYMCQIVTLTFCMK